MVELPYSRSAIDRAGATARDWYVSPNLELDSETSDALVTLWNYRSTFRKPLQKVTVGLRQFVDRESTRVIVSQRQKRLPTIVDKLSRLPKMKVTRMEDIGGCRAILPGGRPEIEGVLARMKTNRWKITRIRDYVVDPKPTGYRAVHVVVERDDRPIEIQLRTPGQHAWAAEVERVGAMLGFPLKDGEGPDDLVEFFRMLGYSLALQDQGVEADAGHKVRFVAIAEYVERNYPDVFDVR